MSKLFSFFKSSRIGLFAICTFASTGVLATTIMLHFPVLNVLASQTFTLQGYESFKGIVEGHRCAETTKKRPNAVLTIGFNEWVHPDAVTVDGRSGASTKSKQAAEIMKKFKVGGQFAITLINDADMSDTPLTGYYSGNAKTLKLSFDHPETLIATRSVCQSTTEWAIARDKFGAPLFSATLTMNNNQQSGSLVIDSQLLTHNDTQHLSRYQAVFTVSAH